MEVREGVLAGKVGSSGAPAKEEAPICKAWSSPTTQYTDGMTET